MLEIRPTMRSEESSSLLLPKASSVSVASSLRAILDYFSVPQLSVVAFQILLAVFFPPLLIGSKKLFLGDAWVLIWGMLGWMSAPRGRYRSLLISVAFVFGLVFLHGALRSSLQPILDLMGEGAGSPRFAPGAEFIVGIRLFSWVSAALLLVQWSITSPHALLDISRKIQDLALKVVLALAVVLSLCRVFPFIHANLADFYHFIIPVDIWQGRVFGVFQSPLEAGATFGLLSLLSIRSEFKLWKVLLIQSIGLFGVWLTGSFSPFVSLAVIAALRIYAHIESRRIRVWILAGVFAAFNILISLLLNSFLMTAKFGGGWARSLLWNAYVKELFSRLDSAVFGFGFIPFYVDNSYLWILTRGGLVLLFSFLVIAADAISKRWSSWGFDQKAVVGYLALTGLALDVIIIRPVVLIFIAAGIPYLAASISRYQRTVDARPFSNS